MTREPLAVLERHADFVRRHIGPSEAEVAEMLATLGLASLDDLIDRAIPAAIRRERAMELGAARNESETLAELRSIAGENRVFRSFIGMGYYGCHTPPVIL